RLCRSGEPWESVRDHSGHTQEPGSHSGEQDARMTTNARLEHAGVPPKRSFDRRSTRTSGAIAMKVSARYSDVRSRLGAALQLARTEPTWRRTQFRLRRRTGSAAECPAT